MSDQYDSPWKDILERYFCDFMAFFFPAAHAEIDWQRGYESLDTELQQIVRDAELGKRLADKLMKVWRCDGETQIVLIHIEVQGEHDTAFAHRMYVYNYRLHDRYQRPIVSLGVLGDGSAHWRPDHYQEQLWGCRTDFRFPIVKLTDYNERWRELETTPNPFAIVVMTHLKTRATRDDAENRLRWKLHLLRQLYERGYQREDVLELFRFIDWLLILPDALEQHFHEQLVAYEATMSTPYITSIERRGIQQGINQGISQGEAALLSRQLVCKFGPLPEWVDTRLHAADRETLERWGVQVLEADSLEAVFH